MRILLLSFITIIAFTIVGCGGGDDSSGVTTGTPNQPITFDPNTSRSVDSSIMCSGTVDFTTEYVRTTDGVLVSPPPYWEDVKFSDAVVNGIPSLHVSVAMRATSATPGAPPASGGSQDLYLAKATDGAVYLIKKTNTKSYGGSTDFDLTVPGATPLLVAPATCTVGAHYVWIPFYRDDWTPAQMPVATVTNVDTVSPSGVAHCIRIETLIFGDQFELFMKPGFGIIEWTASTQNRLRRPGVVGAG